MSIIIHLIFAIFRDPISFMLPFTESSACVQKIGYAISRTFQPYSFLLIKKRSLLHGVCAFMQNMHEQSPIALLRFSTAILLY